MSGKRLFPKWRKRKASSTFVRRKAILEPLEPRLLLSSDDPLKADLASSIAEDTMEDLQLAAIDQAWSKMKKAPELLGLRLIDPGITSFRGLIFNLNFDDAVDVTYNGLVTVGPFDVSAFQAPESLVGQDPGNDQFQHR